MKKLVLIVPLLGLLTACLENPPPRLAPAVQETIFTPESISGCSSILWQEQLLLGDDTDITDAYTYTYFMNASIVQSQDSLARLRVTAPGVFYISPQVNFTSAVKIINSYTCEKTSQTLAVTELLRDGSSKRITVDFSTKLFAR